MKSLVAALDYIRSHPCCCTPDTVHRCASVVAQVAVSAFRATSLADDAQLLAAVAWRIDGTREYANRTAREILAVFDAYLKREER